MGAYNVYSIQCHIVCCVKYKHKIITKEVEDILTAILNKIADDNYFQVYQFCKAGIYSFLASCKSMVSYTVIEPPYLFIASSIFEKNSLLMPSSIAIWSEYVPSNAQYSFAEKVRVL